MKKALALILCSILVLLTACISMNNDENLISLLECYETSLSALHPLDVKFEAVMSDYEIRGNINAIRAFKTIYGDKWRDEMERYLELMQSELDEEAWELVAISQANWETFKWSDIDVLNQAYLHYYNNATITLLYRASNHYERFRNRALHLQMLYELLTADPNRV